jgi:hypothetical protein
VQERLTKRKTSQKDGETLLDRVRSSSKVTAKSGEPFAEQTIAPAKLLWRVPRNQTVGFTNRRRARPIATNVAMPPSSITAAPGSGTT